MEQDAKPVYWTLLFPLLHPWKPASPHRRCLHEQRASILSVGLYNKASQIRCLINKSNWFLTAWNLKLQDQSALYISFCVWWMPVIWFIDDHLVTVTSLRESGYGAFSCLLCMDTYPIHKCFSFMTYSPPKFPSPNTIILGWGHKIWIWETQIFCP